MTSGQRRETPAAPPQTEAQVIAGKNDKFDEARQQHSGARRRQRLSGQPTGHRGAAAGQQHAAGQGAVAGSRRNAGFRRQRRTACAQRARQPSISHQRHHAARRRRRLRADPRHRHRRQPGAAYRRAAGAIWLAHRGRARHPDQGGRLQQLAAASASMAAATARSRRASNMAARSDKPSISCPGAFCRTIWESKIRHRRTRPSTTARRRKRDFSIFRRCSIPPAA